MDEFQAFKKEVRKTFGEVISAMGVLQDRLTEIERFVGALPSMGQELVQHRQALSALLQGMGGGDGGEPQDTEIEATERAPRQQRAPRYQTAPQDDDSEDAWAARRAQSAARVAGMAAQGPAPVAPTGPQVPGGPAPVGGTKTKSHIGNEQYVSFVPAGPPPSAPAAPSANGQSA